MVVRWSYLYDGTPYSGKTISSYGESQLAATAGTTIPVPCHDGGKSLSPIPNLNSLAPGRSECDSKNVIFNLVLLIGISRSSHDNALQWMPQDLTDDKSTLVQVMAWCRQAQSHYLRQCWLSSLSPYGVARPQWVKWLELKIGYQECWLSSLSPYGVARPQWVKWLELMIGYQDNSFSHGHQFDMFYWNMILFAVSVTSATKAPCGSTHCTQSKMVAVLQMTYSNAFFFMMKIVLLLFQSLLNFILSNSINNVSMGSDNGMVPNRRQAIIRTTDGPETYVCQTLPRWTLNFHLTPYLAFMEELGMLVTSDIWA